MESSDEVIIGIDEEEDSVLNRQAELFDLSELPHDLTPDITEFHKFFQGINLQHFEPSTLKIQFLSENLTLSK
jgi:hypothetical protein